MNQHATKIYEKAPPQNHIQTDTHTHVLYNCETFEAKLLQKQTSVISTKTKRNHRQKKSQQKKQKILRQNHLLECLFVCDDKKKLTAVTSRTRQQNNSETN